MGFINIVKNGFLSFHQIVIALNGFMIFILLINTAVTFSSLASASTIKSSKKVIRLGSGVLTGSASTSIGSKAEYDYDPGNYLSFGFGLRWKPDHTSKYSLGASQGLTYRNRPWETVTAGDTSLSASFSGLLDKIDVLESWTKKRKISLSANTSTLLPHSEGSREAGLFGMISGSLSLGWQAMESLSFSINSGLTGYFWDSTMSASGYANTLAAKNLSISSSLSFAKFGYSLSAGIYESVLHEQWGSEYGYSSSLSASYSYQLYRFGLGLSTNDNQLRYGNKQSFTFYDKDRSKLAFSVSKSIF